jgi:hypothetical protein
MNDTMNLWKTLDEAIAEMEEGKVKGIVCPCCKQFAKIYNRKLNSAMAYSLILVAKYFEENPHESSVHVEQYLSKTTRATDFYKLRFWGLIEESDRTSHWMVSPKGFDFVNNKVKVPKKVAIYNNEFIGESRDQTSIVEALGDKFDFSELMGSSLD